MSLMLNRGRMVLDLPEAAFFDPELREAWNTYQQALADQRAAGQKLHALRGRKLEAAKADDAAARASHIKSGSKSKFKPEAVAAVETQTVEAAQEADAREVLVEEAERAFVGLIETKRDEYLAFIATRMSELAESYASAVRTLERARYEVHTLKMLSYWFQAFPDDPKFRPGIPRPIRGPQGEVDFSVVIASLLEDAKQLVPKDDDGEEVN